MGTIIEKVFNDLYEKYIKNHHSDFSIVLIILGGIIYFNLDNKNIPFLQEQKQFFYSKELGYLEIVFAVITITACTFFILFLLQGVISIKDNTLQRKEYAIHKILASAKITYYSLPLSILVFDILLNKAVYLANKPPVFDLYTGHRVIYSFNFIETSMMIAYDAFIEP